MDRKKKWIAGGALALAVLAGGATLAIASAGDDDQPLTGSALEQATAAALEHTDGGTVIESEAGDDGAAFGVEIRLDDGSVVEVALDADFQVIGDSVDDDGAAGEGVGEDEGATESGTDDD
jgi:uncharacterized membrane protein YkoI